MKRFFSVPIVILLGVGLTLLAPAISPGATTKAQLKAKALALSDLPSGWSIYPPSGTSAEQQGCLSGLKAGSHRGEIRFEDYFVKGNGLYLSEELGTGRVSSNRFNHYLHTLSTCRRSTAVADGTRATITVSPMSFPSVGRWSTAFSVEIDVQGVSLDADLVLFKVGQIDAQILYGDLGRPNITQVEAIVTNAENKIEGKATQAVVS